MRLASSVQPTAEKNKISAMRIRMSTVFSPAPLCSQFQKSNRLHALRSSMIATQTVRMRATLRDTDIQLFTRFCSSG